MNDLTIPPKLKKGDCIGIICPSAGVNPKAKHRLDNAIKMIEKLGYRVKLGKTIFSESFVSGSIKERVSDIHKMFKDDDVKAIIPAIGGLCLNQLLSQIDYKLIGQNPKIVLGYSDITVLHFAINTQSNLSTYYGPCAITQFGEYPEILKYTLNSFILETSEIYKKREILPSETWTEEFLDWFNKEDLVRPREQKNNGGYLWMRDGIATGEALPACIGSINHLLGTKYWIDTKGKILILDLLIEEGEMSYPTLDAYLTDLYNANVFNDISGLILSRPSGFSKIDKKLLHKRIKELTNEKDYPIVSNFDIGHTDPINTIRYGQTVKINSKYKTITVEA